MACAEDQFALGGFCYHMLDGASVKDREKTCFPDPTKAGGRNGMPAAPSAPLRDKLATMDSTAEGVAVGAYR